MRHLRTLLLNFGLVFLLGACGPETPKELVAKGKAELARGEPRAAAIHFKTALQAESAVETRALLGRALAESNDARGAVVELNRALEQRADPSTVLPWLARAMNDSAQAKKLLEQHARAELQDKAAAAMFQTQLAVAYLATSQRAQADEALRAATAAVPDYQEALLLQTRMLILDRKFEQALALTERVLGATPKSAAALHHRGDALLGLGRPAAEAEGAWRKSLEADPAYVPAHAALVMAPLRAGDMPTARKQLAAMQKAAPDHPETVFLGAQMAFFDKDYPKARELVQLLLRHVHENPGLLQLAAAVEWQGGSLVIAQKMLETAIRVEPSLEMARINLAYVNLRLNQPGKAMTALEPLLKAPQAPAGALAAAGEAALQLGDPAAAEQLFSRAAKARPDDTRAGTSVAMAQLAQGQAGPAFASLQSLREHSPDGYVESAIASARLARSELPEALQAADALVRKTPDSASAHQLRGRILLAQRDLPAARAALEKSLALEPRFMGSVMALAELDLLQGKPESARARIDNLLAADPRNHVAIAELASLRLKAGAELKDVQASLMEAIKIAPDEAAPRLKLVEILSTRRQVKAALSAAQEAAAALPSDIQVLDALGRMLWADGNGQQALVVFRKILSIDPNQAVAYTRMAELQLAEGNKSAAVASYRRAVEINPRLGEARTKLVNLLVDNKRTKEALEISADLQKREPHSAAGYLLEGAVQRKLGNHEASAAAYRRGLKDARDPGDLPLNYFVALLAAKNWKQAEGFAIEHLTRHPEDGAIAYNLAEGYFIQKDYRQAETYFAKALALRPDHVPSMNNLAQQLLLQGKPGALTLAQRAAQLAPDLPAVQDTLAAALAADKRWPEALAAQKQAVRLAPGDPALRLGLAKLALQSGDKALAREELSRLAAMGSRNPLQDETARLLKSL
jgi:putative PEP-CTERM system TPR-repeat lipoprotein